jgi:hypothetical protein
MGMFGINSYRCGCAAGARAGGSGSRRIDRVLGFSCKDGIV